MKYLDVSKKIKLNKKMSQTEVKNALLARLEKAFRVEKSDKTKSGFHLIGKTGGCGCMGAHARVSIDAKIVTDKDSARILLTGYSKVSSSLFLSYTALFFVVLMVGLLPGSIETSGPDSSAMDALVLLIFGIFIFYDINKKIAAPKCYLNSVLNALDVEYGAP